VGESKGGGVGGGLRLTFRHTGTDFVPKKPKMAHKPHYKAKHDIR